jgi:hypothetical protein
MKIPFNPCTWCYYVAITIFVIKYKSSNLNFLGAKLSSLRAIDVHEKVGKDGLFWFVLFVCLFVCFGFLLFFFILCLTIFQLYRGVWFIGIKYSFKIWYRLGYVCSSFPTRDRRVRDRMVVGFTTTYAIGAYHHWWCGFDSLSGRGVQHYVIKFVSDLW